MIFLRVLLQILVLFLFTTCVFDECENNSEPILSYRFGHIYKHDDHYHVAQNDYNCRKYSYSSTRINSIEVLENEKTLRRDVSICGSGEIFSLYIPLNLNSSQVSVLFNRDSKTDTLKFNYQLSFVDEGSCGLVYHIDYLKTQSTLYSLDQLQNLDIRTANEEPITNSDYGIFYANYVFVVEEP